VRGGREGIEREDIAEQNEYVKLVCYICCKMSNFHNKNNANWHMKHEVLQTTTM
jgi:hypothetical protein